MCKTFNVIAGFLALLFLLAGCGSNGTSTAVATPQAPPTVSDTPRRVPTISSVTPLSAAAGATVTITGTDFSTNLADNTVSFNGTVAVVNSCTSSQIITTVPSVASTGPITVTVAGNSAVYATFSVEQPELAYVANFGRGSVSAFSINPSTGALTEINNSPFVAGSGSDSVTVDPTGRFLYVANFGETGVVGGTISAYTINAMTGALTEISGSPFAAGTNPASVTVDPTGRFAYVATYGSGLSAYSVNATTGALTEISGSPFASGSIPGSITVDPTGNFAYVATFDSGVSAYSINLNTGALTEISGSPFAANTSHKTTSVAVDPVGKFLYVANYGSGNVSAFSINATTGALTEINGSPYAAGQYPHSVIVDRTGKFAYVSNFGSGTISAYSINPTTGALAEISGSPFADVNRPWSIITVKK